MEIIDFYNEKKFCEKCGDYVRFLMSVDHSFCVHCGTKVRLFSKEDLKSFTASLQREKPATGRRRRTKAS
ncbi:MAG: hypothetical protein R3F30_11780 [Planctomycetota bacterium]